MFGLGIWELVLILLIVLVLFGRKLPDLGEGLGRGIRNFRKSMREPDEIDVTPKESQSRPIPPAGSRIASADSASAGWKSPGRSSLLRFWTRWRCRPR
ncbi:MAG: twin-arginine translocase TatA/TatE family subunit [Deltaproteobacteria bacterium]|nr:twin-arginine translocase TatA/TatE family subunit [Deltaproteobacteria bacterium]